MSQPWTPAPYQDEGVRRLLANPAYGLFWDPGLRKTSTTLAALTVLFAERAARTALVVAPLRVCHAVWPIEAAKWEQFEHLDVTVVHGAPRQRTKIAEAEADIYVVNPEGLIWLLDYWNGWVPDVLIVDESTKFKNANSERFRALRKHLGHFKRRHCLTGTPAPNDLQDLWAQAFIMDGGKALGERIGLFRDRWFHRVGNPEWHQWAPRPGAEKEIYEALSPLVYRLDKRDHLKDLPEIHVTDVPVLLSSEARDIYREMEREFVVRLREGTIDAETAASTSMKLRQIATGRVYDEHKNIHVIHREKESAFADLYEQIGEPCLVAYEFGHECDAVIEFAEKSRLRYVVVGGDRGVKGKQQMTAEKDWNAGKYDLFIAHRDSAGYGLNLQDGGRTLIEYGHTWNRGNLDQMRARLWRSGQKLTTMVYRLVAQGTIEGVVLASNEEKGTRQFKLLNALKEHYLVPERKARHG